MLVSKTIKAIKSRVHQWVALRSVPQLIIAYHEKGITIQYLGFPRDGVEGDVFNNMQSAWCSNNKKESLTKLKLGEEIEKKLCQNPIKEHFRKGSLIGITGTPTIVLDDGRKFSGYIPAGDLIELIENG